MLITSSSRKALELSLNLARSGPSSTALVHPLLELRGEEGLTGHHSGRALLEGGGSWQVRALVDGNMIDAMALIRRTSWHKVGGYAAVRGWEDYDLWCRVIEAGFHGVTCPQRLPTYHRHRESMLANVNRDELRQLKHLMQQRHHWLQLLSQPT